MQHVTRVNRRAWPITKQIDPFVFADKLAACLNINGYSAAGALSWVPNYTGSVNAFACHWQMYHLLRKYPDIPGLPSPREAAVREFVRCEEECARTNQRFSEYGLNGPWASVLRRAQKKISQILGPVPSLHDLDLRFGPGGVFGLRGNPTIIDKIDSPLQLTATALELFPELRATLPHVITSPVELVTGSRLSFVPKSAKTDRSICIEPVLNGMVQKGIGTYMKRRLLLAGIDLRDQGINRKLARDALKRGLATVDLSSASDLISFGIVYRLLPLDWVELLDKARSHNYLYGGVWREFHKFSSMGCAFTFELETLIFWALSGSLVGFGNVAVYGDDILVPSSALQGLLSLLQYCGFRANMDKTFGSGPFRESCGGDYYFGCDVTPFRIKKKIRTVVDVFWLANALKAWAGRVPLTTEQSHSVVMLYRWVLSHVPKKDHLFGPVGYGDGHINASFERARPYTWRSDHSGAKRIPYGRCIEGYWFRTYTEAPHPEKRDEWPLGYALYFADLIRCEPSRALASEGVFRRGVTKKKAVRVIAFVWGDQDDWI